MFEQDLLDLKHESADVRFEAARRLGSTLDARATAALIETLGDEQPKVQYAAMSSLIKHGDPTALGPLVDLLRAAPGSPIWKLVTMGAGLRLRAGLLDMVAEGDTGMADRVLDALETPEFDSHQRALFTRMLGRAADTRQVEPFIALLASDDDVLRAAAADALGWIGDARAVEPLIAILENGADHEAVREIAAESLGRLGSDTAAPALLAALKDGNEWIRRAAALSLSDLGAQDAVEPLAALLMDEHTIVQDAAFEALQKLSTDSFSTQM